MSLSPQIQAKLSAAYEAFQMTQSTKSTLDHWKECEVILPKTNILILGWDGFKVFRCRYDEVDKKWYDEDGKQRFVFNWRRI